MATPLGLFLISVCEVTHCFPLVQSFMSKMQKSQHQADFVEMTARKQFAYITNDSIQTHWLYCAPLHTPHLQVATYILYAMHFNEISKACSL